MAAWNLDRLFGPRAIAVIGASQGTSSISGQPLKHLKGQPQAIPDVFAGVVHIALMTNALAVPQIKAD